MKGLLRVLVSGFKVAFLTIITTIKVTISGFVSVIKNLFSFVFDGLGWLAQKISNFGGAIYTTLSGPFGRIRDLLTSVFSGLGGTLNAVFSTVEVTITGLWSRIKSVFLGGFNWLFSHINGAIRSVNKISGVIGIPAIPEMPGFASGIADVPRDMLAVIHQGEAVIPRAENPFRSSNVVKNTFNNSKRNQSTRIDRSIHVSGITIQVSNGTPEDFKTKLLEVFEELAGKSEVLGGAH